MPRVEAFGDPLEEDVAEQLVAAEAEERLSEVDISLFPTLSKPAVPAALQRASHHPGADREAEWSVFRQGAGRIEGDRELAAGIRGEQDGGEE